MINKILVALTLFSIFLIACSDKPQYDSFTQCLTENDAVMYGTEWCSHCQNQKRQFGSSFEYVNFVDCDQNKIVCEERGIRGYPTWIINGTKYTGEQPLYRLAQYTGCELE